MKETEGRLGLIWRRNPLVILLAYALLIAASLICLVPFLWLISTSAKVDREVFSSDRMAPPGAPNARVASPFIDRKFYDASKLRKSDIEVCRDLIRSRQFPYPAGVNRQLAEEEMAEGLAVKLDATLPEDVRKQGPAQLQIEADKQLTMPFLQQLFENVYRRLEFGELVLKSKDQELQTLGSELPFDRRFKNLTPAVASITEVVDMGTSCALVTYDFSKGDEAIFEQTFRSNFDLRALQRIQLGIHPDDNWQLLHLTVEMLGARYAAERAVPMANFDWGVLNWQQPGPEDDSTRIRNWVHLVKTDTPPGISSDPHMLKVRLKLSRASKARAWYEKLILNYRTTGQYIPFLRYLWTTMYLVILNIVLTIAACSIVAYGLTRVVWPGREFVFMLVLATLMIPAQVTMIPAFLIWKNLGLYNTLAPLWVGSAFGTAVYIFLLRQFMRGIPRDIEDAAKIDGCGILRIYWHIVLPLVRPTLAAIALLTFVGTWNDFKGPLLYLADQRLYSLAFGLYAFSVQVASNPAQTMAASVLMALPILTLFFVAQRHFIQGVTLTAGK